MGHRLLGCPRPAAGPWLGLYPAAHTLSHFACDVHDNVVLCNTILMIIHSMAKII